MDWLLLLAAIGILCFIRFLCNYFSWKKGRGDHRARISFKKFYELYSKNSQRWSLYGDCVQFSSYSFEYFIEFETYLDVLKYKRFRKKTAEEEQKEKHDINQKDLEKELNKWYGKVKEDGKQ